MKNLDKIDFSDNPFLFDLSRLVFRWLVHLKQQVVSRFKTQQIETAIENLTSFIHARGHKNFPSNLEFSKMNNNVFERFMELVNYELEGGDSLLLSKYAAIINGLYSKNEREIDPEILTLILGRNYENDLLLRYALIINDPFGDLKSRYFGDMEETIRVQNYNAPFEPIDQCLKDSSLVDEFDDIDVSFLNVKDDESSPFTESKRIDRS